MENKTEYIFCISTGRSGSNYLENIFSHVSESLSFHEPEPVGNKRVMRRYLHGNVDPMRSLTQQKVAIIEKIKKDCSVYIETNHCFIKGFGWFIPQYIPENKIGVIILKRDKAKVASSYLRVNTSPLIRRGRNWLMTPDLPNTMVAPPNRLVSSAVTYQCARLIKSFYRSVRFLSVRLFRQEVSYPKWLIDYELECLEWYVDEIDEKAKSFKKMYPSIKYYEVNIDDLNSIDSIQKMLAYFGCTCKDSLNDIVGKPTNLKTKYKRVESCP
jgi:hypothetical protein